MRRWLLRIFGGLAALVLLIIVMGAGFVAAFRFSVPSYEGTIEVAGTSAPIRIVRDDHAIPHISASSFDDALFGLGYVHAQDRLWQMEMSRRYIQGRLSEMFGSLVTAADIQTRTLGLYAASEAAMQHLSPETLRALESYSAGVNAYIASHRGLWPVEFVLSGVGEPEPWRPADSIAVLKGMAAMLSGNANGETARVRAISVLGKTGLQEFLSPFRAAPPPTYLDEIFPATQLGEIPAVPSRTASNNWVVNGAHASGGKPLLANDPHLGFTIPSTWYLAHLSYPGDNLVGGTLAGVPAIIAGHNDRVSWGLTNTDPDTQDLYLERLSDNGNTYQTPGGWAEFETRVEEIRVRFGEPQRITVRSTRHGPVVDERSGGAYDGLAPSGYVIAMAWTALAPDDTTMDGILGMNRAASAAEFLAATQDIVAPMQNVVFADDMGRIGLVLPGRVPLRADINDSLGLYPAPGWDARYDWQGFIPAEQLPLVADPPSGRIATANNKTVPEDYPFTISREWDVTYRHDRIMALLEAGEVHDAASFKAIQLDPLDGYASVLKLRLIAASGGPNSPEAVRLLEHWDGSMLRARPEPLIFVAWARALARRIYADELGPNFPRYWGYRPEFTLRVLDNVEGQGRWCDDRATPDMEDCTSRIRLALDDALTELRRQYGDDPSGWRWGNAHVSRHDGRPFGDFPLIGSWFNREAVMDGGAFTLLRADHRMGAQAPYAAVHGAGYRGIYDLADQDNSLYMISTGQSGNLYSPHYDDLLPLWADGEYVSIPTSEARIRATATHTLTLQPVSAVKLP
jgi:penicillin amidase